MGRDYDDIQAKIRREDAEIANFPNLVETVARLMLTNRALAAALMQLDSDPRRYADICELLDGRASALVELSSHVRLPESRMEEADPVEDSIEEWTGDAEAICIVKTQKGNACTKRAVLSHTGKPYCRSHYPYPDEYFEAQQRQRAQWEAEWQQRRDMLEEYRRLAESATSLSSMNDVLRRAIERLDMKTPDIQSPSLPDRKTETVGVDGLVFHLEQAQYQKCPSWWIQGKDSGRLALLQHASAGEWRVFELDPNTGGFRDHASAFQSDSSESAIRYAHLHDMFYRVRRKRDLGWFGSAISKMVKDGISITSREPLKVLCGIDVPKIGWHVFKHQHGKGYTCSYSGHSEAEARWHYDAGRYDDDNAPLLLLDPGNQVVDYRGDSKRLW